jgi:hypothetical protein
LRVIGLDVVGSDVGWAVDGNSVVGDPLVGDSKVESVVGEVIAIVGVSLVGKADPQAHLYWAGRTMGWMAV